MAAPAGTETIGKVGELRLVIRLQQEADHFADQLIRPGRQAERPFPSVLLRDPDPPYRPEPVTLGAQRIDDPPDPGQRRAVRGLPVSPRRHRPLVGVDATVGQQIQLRVEQLPVQLIARQPTPAAITQDTQHRFGVLHFAYLPAFGYPSPGPLRPVSGSPALPGRPLPLRLLRGLRRPRARAP